MKLHLKISSPKWRPFCPTGRWVKKTTWHALGTVILCVHSAHYNDHIMDSMASQITSLTFVYSVVYLGADQRKHQSSASLAFVRGIHRRSMKSPHKGPVTRKMFPFDDVIMIRCSRIFHQSDIYCTILDASVRQLSLWHSGAHAYSCSGPILFNSFMPMIRRSINIIITRVISKRHIF